VRFFVRYSSLTVLVACLGSSLLMMSAGADPAASVLQVGLRPLQQMLARSVQGVSDVGSRYLYLADVEKSHEEALRELSRLRREVVALQEARHERDRLRALLGFQQKLGRPTIAARVIGWDSSHFAESIVCDRGRADGVEPDMCVITSDGLVGRVLHATEASCKVQLVLDELSNVAALIQNSRVPGIVTGQGAGRPLVLRYVPKSAELSLGDAVVASGIDGLYQKGLLVGYISQVDNDSTSLFQKIQIRPSVEMERVEEVLIFAAQPVEPEAGDLAEPPAGGSGSASEH
jgi:rod shape-determining protein MreC